MFGHQLNVVREKKIAKIQLAYDGLLHTHKHGIFHNNLKANNVVLEKRKEKWNRVIIAEIIQTHIKNTLQKQHVVVVKGKLNYLLDYNVKFPWE